MRDIILIFRSVQIKFEAWNIYTVKPVFRPEVTISQVGYRSKNSQYSALVHIVVNVAIDNMPPVLFDIQM